MSDEEQKTSEEEKKIKISSTEEVKRGVYTNVAVISHSNEEFIMDFIFRGEKEGTLNARVILSPSHFMRFAKAVDVNLKRYEKKFGKIPEKVEERKKVH